MWYLIWISTFLVELHLDDVLKVLMVDGAEFLSYETYSEYQRKIHRKNYDKKLNYSHRTKKKALLVVSWNLSNCHLKINTTARFEGKEIIWY